MPKTAPKPYASLKKTEKFPEDIECIIKSPCPENGSLYISNIEAAENLSTLKSMPFSKQSSKLRRS